MFVRLIKAQRKIETPGKPELCFSGFIIATVDGLIDENEEFRPYHELTREMHLARNFGEKQQLPQVRGPYRDPA